MSQASLQLMKTFLKSLNGNDWNRLQPFHVKLLRSLQHLKIDTTFLHAAATFWDTRDHVFIFNGQELCPLIEEFTAILILLPWSFCLTWICRFSISWFHSLTCPQITSTHLCFLLGSWVFLYSSLLVKPRIKIILLGLELSLSAYMLSSY